MSFVYCPLDNTQQTLSILYGPDEETNQIKFYRGGFMVIATRFYGHHVDAFFNSWLFFASTRIKITTTVSTIGAVGGIAFRF